MATDVSVARVAVGATMNLRVAVSRVLVGADIDLRVAVSRVLVAATPDRSRNIYTMTPHGPRRGHLCITTPDGIMEATP